VVGGLAFGSLALLADAAHMVADVVALTMAYAALLIARRPATERHTFGFARTEVLVAQANGMLLIGGALVIVFEAIGRLREPTTMDAAGVLIIGGLGLVVNVVSAAFVARHAHGSLNLRGALLHLLADALGSVAVIVAAAGTWAFGFDRLDPIASLFIAVLVLVAAWHLIRDATRVLLEAVPAGLDATAVRDALVEVDGVEAVHHLHLWTTGSEHAALSAHVVLEGTLTLHDAQIRADGLKRLLATRFGIEHATIEVECHACADDETPHGAR